MVITLGLQPRVNQNVRHRQNTTTKYFIINYARDV
jgi:hypothetical protein